MSLVRFFLNFAAIRSIAGRFFPRLLVKAGKNCRIHRTVRFEGASIEQIEIGNNVYVANDVCFCCSGKDAKIIIGDNVWIGAFTQLQASANGKIIIGSRSSLNVFCVVYGQGGVEIGSECRIAAQTLIVSHNHNFSRRDLTIKEQGITRAKVRIGDDVWLGAGCKILAGVEVGNGAVIGAGGVVSKNIPSYAVAVGVPAKIIGSRDDANRMKAENADFSFPT